MMSAARNQQSLGALDMVKNTSRIMLPLFLLLGVAHGLPLLGGRFETTTDVQGLLNLGLDVAAMEQINDEQKENIYRNVSIIGQVLSSSLDRNSDLWAFAGSNGVYHGY
jgi:hypothetical protein